MILKLLIALISINCVFVTQTYGQLQGMWEGAFVRENSIQLTQFYFHSSLDDQITGFHNIPERELYAEPISEFSKSNDTMFFRTRYGNFIGFLNKDPLQINAVSVGWNPKIKLHLKRSNSNYQQMDTMNFLVKRNTFDLAATLVTNPEQASAKPLTILVHGSGKTVRSDRYYRTIAYALALRGYPVVIYDKRGCGESGGTLVSSTFFDLARDAQEVLKTAKSKYKQKVKAGFMGISQGGWVSTIAANNFKPADFLILNVGPAVSLYQQEIDRVKYTLTYNDYDTADINRALDHVNRMFSLIDDPSLCSKYLESSKDIMSSNLAEIVNTADTISDNHVAWWRLNAYDPANHLMSLSIPVLSLLGGADNLVPPETNKDLMISLLEKSSSPYYNVHVFDNANHDLEIYGRLEGNAWDWPKSYWVWPRKADDHYEVIKSFLEKIR